MYYVTQKSLMGFCLLQYNKLTTAWCDGTASGSQPLLHVYILVKIGERVGEFGGHVIPSRTHM